MSVGLKVVELINEMAVNTRVKKRLGKSSTENSMESPSSFYMFLLLFPQEFFFWSTMCQALWLISELHCPSSQRSLSKEGDLGISALTHKP